MYIKIVDSEAGASLKGVLTKHGELVVPKRSFLWEVDYVNYEKRRITEREEIETYAKGVGTPNRHWIRAFPEEISSETPLEFLMVTFFNKMGEKWEEVIAPGCSLYIIGENGETIDSLHCYS